MYEVVLLAVCGVAGLAIIGMGVVMFFSARMAGEATTQLRIVTDELLAATLTLDPRLRAHIASEIVRRNAPAPVATSHRNSPAGPGGMTITES